MWPWTKLNELFLDFGFQGRAISISRPVFASPVDSDQRMAPPRFHPLVADRSSLRARTQQKSPRAVRSTASVPRQGRVALAPGPMGTWTTLEPKSDGRDRTAQLASDTSLARSGAFAPAVDGRPSSAPTARRLFCSVLARSDDRSATKGRNCGGAMC